jgi:hypothetical protein
MEFRSSYSIRLGLRFAQVMMMVCPPPPLLIKVISERGLRGANAHLGEHVPLMGRGTVRVGVEDSYSSPAEVMGIRQRHTSTLQRRTEHQYSSVLAREDLVFSADVA